LQSKGSISVMEHINKIKYLGIKFDLHINEKINKAYSVLDHRKFKHMPATTFTMLYKTSVRSHMEYANCLWSPFRQMDVEKVEKVQMTATQMVKQLKNYSYEDYFRFLKLPTLRYRHLRR